MKIRNIVIAIAIGMLAGIGFCKCTPSSANANHSVVCDSMEQTRLEMALNQCDDAVYFLQWVEENDESR